MNAPEPAGPLSGTKRRAPLPAEPQRMAGTRQAACATCWCAPQQQLPAQEAGIFSMKQPGCNQLPCIQHRRPCLYFKSAGSARPYSGVSQPNILIHVTNTSTHIFLQVASVHLDSVSCQSSLQAATLSSTQLASAMAEYLVDRHSSQT